MTRLLPRSLFPDVLEWYPYEGSTPTGPTWAETATTVRGLLRPSETKVRQRDGAVHVYAAVCQVYRLVAVGDRLGLPFGPLYRVGRVEEHRRLFGWWTVWLDEDLR